MSNLVVRDGQGDLKYISASGAGTDVDPYLLDKDVVVQDGADVCLGVTTGAAVITDADGTLQQYLRGLVKLLVAKVTVKPELAQTLLSACGSAAGAGNNTIIAAPGAGAIYVFGYALQATGGAVNGYLRDGAAGSAVCQTWNFGIREGISRQVTPPGYLFKLTATTLLALNLSGAIACGWEIQYWVA